MTTVAIDGPAGAGKSTVARAVAERLGFRYVDTGAMYRALAHTAIERGIDLDDGEALAAMADGVTIEAGERQIVVDGADVTEAIRTSGVTAAVSRVAAHPEVRRALVQIQRDLADRYDVVMEGRDIGSAVCPDAEVKIYLSASLAERARRRWSELPDEQRPDVAEVALTISQRDEADSTRAAAPLIKSPDALEIDTSNLSIGDVVERIVRHAREEM